ncbi:MAG: RDD family protein [Granulosicoccaceae bacterium]
MSNDKAIISKPAGLFRRLAAMSYDALLLLATMLFALGVALAVNGGEVLPRLVNQIIVLLVIFGFFAFFWRRGGQTLGMQTWRLHLESSDNSPIRVKHCALRIAGSILSFAALGLGYFWLWIDKDKRTWPDMLSGSMVVHRPKKKKQKAKKQSAQQS